MKAALTCTIACSALIAARAWPGAVCLIETRACGRPFEAGTT